MKITWKEVRYLEDFIQRLEDETEAHYWEHDLHISNSWAFFADHPHFLMTMGFDEYVSFENHNQFKHLWFANDVEPHLPYILYRKPSGQWLLLLFGPEDRWDDFIFHSKTSWRNAIDEDDFFATCSKRITLGELFKHLYDIANTWIEDSKVLWHPQFWTPNAQQKEKICLLDSVSSILKALKYEKIKLQEVSWRQLEDIVAEVLRAIGLEIHVVKETPQGGRDIIARGELIPGQEPITMAVEVKHKRVVDRPDVEKALWQNRHYPALLFTTSGRFTSGVFKEKRLPENQLRLFLKDGEALGDLIQDYFFIRK